MQIRGLKPQNFAWKPGLSDSAHPDYDKNSGSQLLLKNDLWSPMQGLFFWNISGLIRAYNSNI